MFRVFDYGQPEASKGTKKRYLTMIMDLTILACKSNNFSRPLLSHHAILIIIRVRIIYGFPNMEITDTQC